MLKKIIKFLAKRHIIKAGMYKVKGDLNKLIEANVESETSASGFYGDIEKKMKKGKRNEDNGENKKGKGKLKLSQIKRKLFIVVGSLFLIYAAWYLIDVLSVGFEGWTWTDFIIIIFFTLGGILCFPFSYARQEKYWGKNITQISISLFVIFIILSFSTASIISDMFAGDAFSFGWIIYVMFIIFLRSLFLPRTILRWERKYKVFNILKRRYYIFRTCLVIFGIALLIDISGSNDGSKLVMNNDGNYIERQVCLGSKKHLQSDARLMQVGFIQNEDKNTVLQKNVFSKNDLIHLSFVIEGSEQDKQRRSNWEICDKNTDTIVIEGDIMQYDVLWPGADQGSDKNEINLDTLSIESGQYVVNILTSSNKGGPWKLAEQIPFRVE